ncbi:acetyl-CoA carboxylase biotin carboxyl carrier protein [Paenibacillus sp. GP183]|uniref:acetyl-CoA carboxylase biotin carboxyl carrier protein n=1 Tax=Paenibacillus sp. GP183 TaxID=1882751 RepID=UPI000895A3D7|nr:acetyl-CoA carboxylase biotin carboxyl carrier protein [Paenibacillus sp. GP183]SEB73012.1 acetyl-CoA carboxylase biotin carboxyl carrier protein [Paenibacillus sp. GP183]
MFSKQELQELIETVSQYPIKTFKYSDGTTNIVIKKDRPASMKQKNLDVPMSEAISDSEETPGLHKISTSEIYPEPLQPELIPVTAPMVGTFYTTAEQGKAPFVQVGDKVTAETVLCILEAMKLFTEVTARMSGEIVEIVAEEGQLVEYGQTLFLVKRD